MDPALNSTARLIIDNSDFLKLIENGQENKKAINITTIFKNIQHLIEIGQIAGALQQRQLLPGWTKNYILLQACSSLLKKGEFKEIELILPQLTHQEQSEVRYLRAIFLYPQAKQECLNLEKEMENNKERNLARNLRKFRFEAALREGENDIVDIVKQMPPQEQGKASERATRFFLSKGEIDRAFEHFPISWIQETKIIKSFFKELLIKGDFKIAWLFINSTSSKIGHREDYIDLMVYFLFERKRESEALDLAFSEQNYYESVIVKIVERYCVNDLDQAYLICQKMKSGKVKFSLLRRIIDLFFDHNKPKAAFIVEQHLAKNYPEHFQKYYDTIQIRYHLKLGNFGHALNAALNLIDQKMQKIFISKIVAEMTHNNVNKNFDAFDYTAAIEKIEKIEDTPTRMHVLKIMLNGSLMRDEVDHAIEIAIQLPAIEKKEGCLKIINYLVLHDDVERALEICEATSNNYEAYFQIMRVLAKKGSFTRPLRMLHFFPNHLQISYQASCYMIKKLCKYFEYEIAERIVKQVLIRANQLGENEEFQVLLDLTMALHDSQRGKEINRMAINYALKLFKNSNNSAYLFDAILTSIKNKNLDGLVEAIKEVSLKKQQDILFSTMARKLIKQKELTQAVYIINMIDSKQTKIEILNDLIRVVLLEENVEWAIQLARSMPVQKSSFSKFSGLYIVLDYLLLQKKYEQALDLAGTFPSHEDIGDAQCHIVKFLIHKGFLEQSLVTTLSIQRRYGRSSAEMEIIAASFMKGKIDALINSVKKDRRFWHFMHIAKDYCVQNKEIEHFFRISKELEAEGSENRLGFVEIALVLIKKGELQQAIDITLKIKPPEQQIDVFVAICEGFLQHLNFEKAIEIALLISDENKQKEVLAKISENYLLSLFKVEKI